MAVIKLHHLPHCAKVLSQFPDVQIQHTNNTVKMDASVLTALIDANADIDVLFDNERDFPTLQQMLSFKAWRRETNALGVIRFVSTNTDPIIRALVNNNPRRINSDKFVNAMLNGETVLVAESETPESWRAMVEAKTNLTLTRLNISGINFLEFKGRQSSVTGMNSGVGAVAVPIKNTTASHQQHQASTEPYRAALA